MPWPLNSFVTGLVHTGRVDFSAQLQTRVLDIMQSGSGFVLMLADGRHLDCDAAVIATGNPLPADPLAASSRVLERHLIDRGMLRQDPLGLGYVTGHNGAAFGLRGPVAGLYLLGPACRPERWENTAVPELRQQADVLATELMRMSSASTSQRARQPGTGEKASSPSRVDNS
ncbi:MAG TPA: FAD/NAD(P)-binding protein, partial [Woeseiaceae bacterium]|nr:FAD/NAD(P)-binding protein [Woeseiaceae bacterium]